jgi:hypothetical protein
VLTASCGLVIVRGDVEWWGFWVEAGSSLGPLAAASKHCVSISVAGRQVQLFHLRVDPRDAPQVNHQQNCGAFPKLQLPEEETGSYVP